VRELSTCKAPQFGLLVTHSCWAGLPHASVRPVLMDCSYAGCKLTLAISQMWWFADNGVPSILHWEGGRTEGR